MAAQGPMVKRRKIGRELQTLRETSGLTIEEAGAAIGRSDSTISRIENGKRDVQLIELKGLLEAYEAPAETREALINLLSATPEETWWTVFDLPPNLDTYVGLEAEADTLRVYVLGAVHSLLRTEEYARAVLRGTSPSAPAGEIEDLLKFHMQRQQVLKRDSGALDLIVVLDEACLWRQVGGLDCQREQLKHLIQLAEEMPNVVVQVLPYSKGAHTAVTGAFTILDFPDPTEPAVVYVDSPAGNLYLQKAKDTRRFDQSHSRLRGMALDEHESVRFMQTVLKEIK
ncbi:helix-turn-helix domain-containing protein [Streptomyces xanthii]|uniref:Helix-turn-helix domain-containing protein n=1 Tax=Streptomyces xanthii TaxID=2768069 RepID=A0A7H1BL74_9ACTN|nr:helix-turn-helix transcriptional regulator [Streptomyces xanthii]QNS09479.1 helix-turn-helix domain-containing protein [Streptomyces xanthii]